MPRSERKRADARKRDKETVAGLKKAWKAIMDKIDRKETLRDEDLRFLRNVADIITALEQRIDESSREDVKLPDGSLRNFIEREWRLKEICKDPSRVIELTGYYECEECGRLHEKGRKCMYEEYKEIKVGIELDNEDNSNNEEEEE